MTTHDAPPVYIIGDIHGQYQQLLGLLRGAGLVDERLDWAGGAALLWFIGDFFDRGPCGVAAVDLVMRLQAQADHITRIFVRRNRAAHIFDSRLYAAGDDLGGVKKCAVPVEGNQVKVAGDHGVIVTGVGKNCCNSGGKSVVKCTTLRSLGWLNFKLQACKNMRFKLGVFALVFCSTLFKSKSPYLSSPAIG